MLTKFQFLHTKYCSLIQASSSNSGGGNQSGSKNQSFNPATHHFLPEELKPTPIQRKSRKTLVRAEDKDDKYWDKVKISFYNFLLKFFLRSVTDSLNFNKFFIESMANQC